MSGFLVEKTQHVIRRYKCQPCLQVLRRLLRVTLFSAREHILGVKDNTSDSPFPLGELMRVVYIGRISRWAELPDCLFNLENENLVLRSIKILFSCADFADLIQPVV